MYFSVGYDEGDRVVMYGDKEFTTYDQRGFVVRRGPQRYTYNSFGRMTSASESGRFSVKFYSPSDFIASFLIYASYDHELIFNR